MIVELYTKDDCGYCIAAKTLLRAKGIDFSEQKLGIHFTREMIKQKYPDASTFPVVVVDGFFIGGYNQLDEQLKREDDRLLLNE